MSSTISTKLPVSLSKSDPSTKPSSEAGGAAEKRLGQLNTLFIILCCSSSTSVSTGGVSSLFPATWPVLATTLLDRASVASSCVAPPSPTCFFNICFLFFSTCSFVGCFFLLSYRLLVLFNDIVDIAHMLLIVARLFFSFLFTFLYLPHHKARFHRPLRHNQVLQLFLLEGVVHNPRPAHLLGQLEFGKVRLAQIVAELVSSSQNCRRGCVHPRSSPMTGHFWSGCPCSPLHRLYSAPH